MLLIEKRDILNLIKELGKTKTIVAPLSRKDGETVFEKTDDSSVVNLEYETTILPAKKFFLPEKETTFIYDSKKRKIATGKIEPFILFGLNLKDTEALTQLDEIMLKPTADFFYEQKRNAATIISIINENGPLPHIGIDLILEKLNQNTYKVHALSKKGREISRKKFFKESNEEITAEKNPETKVMPELKKLLKDPELLKDAMEWSWKNYNEIWEKLGKQCLGCGICTYACPLCYCFSIEDACSLDGKTCSKKRIWSACTLPEFSRITGGHNFHPALKERYYNWFYHKFVRAYKEHGKSQCVACGRCAKYCPAGINIEEILLDIVGKYKSSNKF